MKVTRAVMGMPITVEVIDEGESTAQDAIEGVFDYFDFVDQTFSTYKPDSEISRINQGKLTLSEATQVVRDVLAQCDAMKTRSAGYFDIRRHGQIDPSGLVKGWSIWNAAKFLDKAGIANYCIEAGGDIQVKGHNSEGGPWRVGIRNPQDLTQIVKVLHLKNGAVATSGTYERGEHIYNPLTDKSATELDSVTVVGPNICDADVFATAAFAMGPSGIEWVAKQGLDCYQIAPGGKATYTPGLERYLS